MDYVNKFPKSFHLLCIAIETWCVRLDRRAHVMEIHNNRLTYRKVDGHAHQIIYKMCLCIIVIPDVNRIRG